MSEGQETSAWWTRLSAAIGWDGCLPLIAACSRVVLPSLVGRDLADPVALIIVTPAVALARSHYGSRQLRELCVSPTFSRQAIFAGAIIMLMLFEGLSVMLLSGHPPLVYWFIAATMYFIYLGLITTALRPQ